MNERDLKNLHHPADLPLAAFGQVHFINPPALGLPGKPDPAGRRFFSVDRNPALGLPDLGRGERPGERGFVNLVQAVAGMHEAVGEITVVGDDQKAGGVLVEATDRIQARADGHKIIRDGLTPVGVRNGGDDVPGLVKSEVKLLLKNDLFAPIRHFVFVGRHRESGFQHRLAVHGHKTCLHELRGLSAARHPGS